MSSAHSNRPDGNASMSQSTVKMADGTNARPHSTRLVALGITPGRAAPLETSVKVIRKLEGFSYRSVSWSYSIFTSVNQNMLGEDRDRYWRRLQTMYNKCPGCEMTLCSHVYSFGAKFLEPSEDMDNIDELWEENVFQVHALNDEQQRGSVKRLLMILEEEFDLDYAPCLVDLVALLSLHLTEIQVYAAIRRLMTTSSSTFLKLKAKRDTFTPRRLLSVSFASQMSLHGTFLLSIKKLDPGVYECLTPHSEIRTWFERWLIPIFPMNQVLVFVDCLIAGDDWKLLFRVCWKAIKASRSALMASYGQDPDKHEPTTIVRNVVKAAVQEGKTFMIRSGRFPRRKTLIQLESSLGLRQYGRVPNKVPIAHLPRTAFLTSSTILTFEAASRFMRMIPPQYRHNSPRIRSIFQSDIGPMGDRTLTDLYKACESEKNCVFIMIIAAKVPNSYQDLNEKPFHELERTDSTSFHHPLVKEANYVVFGVFSPTPLISQGSKISESVGNENTFVFRLAPKPVFAKWKIKSPPSSSPLISCLPTSLMVGNTTKLASSSSSSTKMNNGSISSIEPQSNDGNNDGIAFRTVGPALYVSHNLDQGYTGYCETFQNEPLCLTSDRAEFQKNPNSKSSHYYFNIFAVEVFALPS